MWRLADEISFSASHLRAIEENYCARSLVYSQIAKSPVWLDCENPAQRKSCVPLISPVLSELETQGLVGSADGGEFTGLEKCTKKERELVLSRASALADAVIKGEYRSVETNKKKASDAFACYQTERLATLAKESPEISSQDAACRIAEEWHKLDAKAREPYERAAEKGSCEESKGGSKTAEKK